MSFTAPAKGFRLGMRYGFKRAILGVNGQFYIIFGDTAFAVAHNHTQVDRPIGSWQGFTKVVGAM